MLFLGYSVKNYFAVVVFQISHRRRKYPEAMSISCNDLPDRASVLRQIKSVDHQSEDNLFDEENEAIFSCIAEALL